jgi:hypothetical protein
MKIRRRIAVVRREAKWIVAIAIERAAQAKRSVSATMSASLNKFHI